MSGGITLGHFLIAIAILELLMIPLMVRSARRANAGVTAVQGGGFRLVVFAAVAAAAGLCLVALFHPVAQIRLV